MFKFLKEKLSNWKDSLVKKEEKKVEPAIEKKETQEKAKKETKKKEKVKKEKQQKALEKVEEIVEEKEIEETQEEELQNIVEEKEEVIEEEKKGFFSRLREKATTIEFSDEQFEEQFETLETNLIENNVALEAIDVIKFKLKQKIVGKRFLKKEFEGIVSETLKDSLQELLIEPFNLVDKIRSSDKPYVILFFGINGTGKTTSIAKLAYFLKQNHISCILAAADTFRAASIEQLEIHGNKLGVKVIKQAYGSDPAAVAFDAVKYAKAHNIDAVLIDTAGRMYTKADLLKEMEKISRVSKPNLKLFIAESTTGNDAIDQAKNFAETVGIDGSILTKADIDEKGGTIISISHATKKPILFLGVGQEYKDLEPFNKNKILERLGL